MKQLAEHTKVTLTTNRYLSDGISLTEAH